MSRWLLRRQVADATKNASSGRHLVAVPEGDGLCVGVHTEAIKEMGQHFADNDLPSQNDAATATSSGG